MAASPRLLLGHQQNRAFHHLTGLQVNRLLQTSKDCTRYFKF